jgi:predicted RNase H-like HicB family nuclease
MKYLIVIEETANGYSAYSPDLPGCASVGGTIEETERNMREAIELQVSGLRAEGLSVPRPTTRSSYVEITAAWPHGLRVSSS